MAITAPDGAKKKRLGMSPVGKFIHKNAQIAFDRSPFFHPGTFTPQNHPGKRFYPLKVMKMTKQKFAPNHLVKHLQSPPRRKSNTQIVGVTFPRKLPYSQQITNSSLCSKRMIGPARNYFDHCNYLITENQGIPTPPSNNHRKIL